MSEQKTYSIQVQDDALSLAPSISDYEALEKSVVAKIEKDGTKVVSVDKLDISREIGRNTTLTYTMTIEPKAEPKGSTSKDADK